MGRKKDRYHKIEHYSKFLQKLKKRKSTFHLSATTYTKIIKRESVTDVFNETGKPDHQLLHLINNVRKDADSFIECNGEVNPPNIHFFDFIGQPENNQVISKIDVRSAYWQYALNEGIISQKTDEIFLKILDQLKKELNTEFEPSEAKELRLKALGSLATRKQIIPYNKGKAVYSKEKIIVRKTKPLYLHICHGIDSLMRECINNIDNIYYYYWDCIFCHKDYAVDVYDFFRDKSYDIRVENIKPEFIKAGRNYYMITKPNNKVYMIRYEDKHLLDKNII